VGVGPPLKIHGELKAKIIDGLERQWSPEQISGTLRLSGVMISHESIYQFVYRSRREDSNFYQNLRRKHRYRRTGKTLKNIKSRGFRRYENWIDKRPIIVEQRKRIGDIERDTMLGKFGGPVLLTAVDRTSRLTKITKVEKINAMLTHQATVTILQGMKIETITNDNGPEFSMYDFTERDLNASVYFSRPYCSWQRGTNENTNGLIRQYFPKGTDFSKITKKELKRVQNELNERPRKTLLWKSPKEVFKKEILAKCS
jgi:IS30 family transposase